MTLQETRQMVNPSLVPLLSTLSRVSPGCLQSRQDDHEETIVKFKAAFFQHLKSRVINVRKLAARAFAAFTSSIEEEMLFLITSLKISGISTNFENGLLHCLLELSKRANPDDIKDDLRDVNPKCCANALLMKQILDVKLGGKCLDIFQRTYGPMDPYNKAFQEEVLAADASISTNRPIGLKDFEKVFHQPKKLVELLMACKKNGSLHSELLLGAFGMISNHGDIADLDEESAEELLRICFEEKLLSGDFGMSVKTSSMIVASRALSVMMLLDKNQMFFQDGSKYASKFEDITEQIRDSSNPDRIETSRFDSAGALQVLAPVFNERKVFDFPLISR